MTSTLIDLVEEFKKNKTDLKQLPAIIDRILNNKYDEEQRIKASKEINMVVSKLINKIDCNKQVSTFKYLSNITVKLAQTFCCCSIISNNVEEWLSILAELFETSTCKTSIAGVVVKEILHNSSVILKYLKNGEFILAIINQITNEQIQNNYPQILNAIVQLQHFDKLQFKDSQNKYGLSNAQQQLKKAFQDLLISCLKHLDSTCGEQSHIYSIFGQKLFSKLASPLVLSEHLLGKLKTEDNPQLQIQVLSSLFVLVGKYQLQLQRFYDNLQHIIKNTPSLRHSLFRATNSKRLLRLVEAALRSSKVPFKNIKNITHLLLNRVMAERSQFCFWMLSFLVNLVKKHGQLQSHLSQFPQIAALRYHYSAKIRKLVAQLYKNQNKQQYLDIDNFAKINCEKLCGKSLQEICNKIDNNLDEFEFKVPNSFDYL